MGLSQALPVWMGVVRDPVRGRGLSLFQVSKFPLIQINHQPDATISQFIILTFIYSSTCFGLFLAHHQELNDCSGSLWFYFGIVVTAVQCSWSGRPELYDDICVTRPQCVKICGRQVHISALEIS